jgi:biopolymer transport protein ExbD
MNSLSELPGVRRARIEIIPLIDVIFFLLATFVLFTLSLDSIRSVDVVLPQGGDPRDQPFTLFLEAAEGDTVYWQEGATGAPELIAQSDVPGRLAAFRARESRPRVIVRGNDHAKLGAAVRLLDAVRAERIAEVSIETRPGATHR